MASSSYDLSTTCGHVIDKLTNGRKDIVRNDNFSLAVLCEFFTFPVCKLQKTLKPLFSQT
jgi:hypothetical protein